jgi:hypothetical protein
MRRLGAALSRPREIAPPQITITASRDSTGGATSAC